MQGKRFYPPAEQARQGVDAYGNKLRIPTPYEQDCCTDACGPSCGKACAPPGASPNLVFAGRGMGEYVQDTKYQYVGEGAGEFALAPTRGTNWCLIFGIIAASLGLVALLLVIFWPVATDTSTTTKPLYDCDAGFDNQQKGWTLGKKAWCCEKAGRGCPSRPAPKPKPAPPTKPAPPMKPAPPAPPAPGVTPAPLGYCNQGGVSEWDAEKKAYCCKHFNNGCDTPEPTPAPAPQYDCEAGFANWEAGWSINKKAWCCEHAGKGCAKPGCTTSAPYDCLAGFGNWEAGWSVGKKQWCCEHTGKGCPPKAGGCA